MAEARTVWQRLILSGSQGGSILFSGGSWRQGCPFLVRKIEVKSSIWRGILNTDQPFLSDLSKQTYTQRRVDLEWPFTNPRHWWMYRLSLCPFHALGLALRRFFYLGDFRTNFLLLMCICVVFLLQMVYMCSFLVTNGVYV